MLIKLMKQEFRAKTKLLTPIMIAFLLFSVLFRVFTTTDVDELPAILTVAFGGITIVFVLLCYTVVLAPLFVSLKRFEKSLFSDEGYLSNTLPVTAFQHILSKIITTIVWYIITVATIIAGVAIIFVENKSEPDFVPGVKSLLKNLGEAFREDTFESVSLLLVLILGFLILYGIMYFSTALANSMQNNKKIWEFCLVFLVGILYVAIIVKFIFVFDNNDVSGKAGMAILLAYHLVFCIAIYFATNYVMKHRLNLE